MFLSILNPLRVNHGRRGGVAAVTDGLMEATLVVYQNGRQHSLFTEMASRFFIYRLNEVIKFLFPSEIVVPVLPRLRIWFGFFEFCLFVGVQAKME